MAQIYTQELKSINGAVADIPINNNGVSQVFPLRGNWLVLDSTNAELLNKDKGFEERVWCQLNSYSYNGEGAFPLLPGVLVQTQEFSQVVLAVRTFPEGSPAIVNQNPINARLIAGSGKPLFHSRTGDAVKEVEQAADRFFVKGLVLPSGLPPKRQVYVKKDRVMMTATTTIVATQMPSNAYYGVPIVNQLLPNSSSTDMVLPNTTYALLSSVFNAKGFDGKSYPFGDEYTYPYGYFIDTLTRRNAQARFNFTSITGFAAGYNPTYGLMAGNIDYSSGTIFWVPIGQAVQVAQNVPGIIDISRGTYDLLTDYFIISTQNEGLPWGFTYNTILEAND